MFICPSCEWENDESDVICMGCGYPIGNEDPDFMRPQEATSKEWWEEEDE